jgi:hypothetical protein
MDLKSVDNFSLWIHLDGSITLKKDDIEIQFVDLDMVKVLYKEELLEDVFLFDDNYYFYYEREGNKKRIVYDNEPKKIKNFENFNNKL